MVVAPKKQLIIGFKSGTRRSTCLELHKQFNGRIVEEIKQIGVHVVDVSLQDLSACKNKYSSCKHVNYVEENEVVYADVIPRDPLFERQWGLENINASAAWGIGDNVINSMTSKIAILDSGIDTSHEDFRGKIILNANFSDSPTVSDPYGHGTHVTGIAAALTNNRTGIAGMSFNSAGIMNIKVLGDTGGGSITNVVKGILYAADQGADVINLSLGGGVDNESLRNATEYASIKGALLVGSAGNNATANLHYPAAYKQVVAVAATNETNEIASFSNYGSWVDVAAPGQNIFSTISSQVNNNANLYRSASGTSQAAPFVSGLAALLKAINPSLTNREMRFIIQQSSDTISSSRNVRFGKINARQAIQLARSSSRNQLNRTQNTSSVWLNFNNWKL